MPSTTKSAFKSNQILALPWLSVDGDPRLQKLTQHVRFWLSNQLLLQTPLIFKDPSPNAWPSQSSGQSLETSQSLKPLNGLSEEVLLSVVETHRTGWLFAGQWDTQTSTLGFWYRLWRVDLHQPNIAMVLVEEGRWEASQSKSSSEFEEIQSLCLNLFQVFKAAFSLQGNEVALEPGALKWQPVIHSEKTLNALLDAEAMAFGFTAEEVQARMRLYRNILDDDPTQEIALMNLARLYQTQGDYQQAVSLYQQALQHSQAQPSIKAYYANEIGICLALLNRRSDAKTFWRQAVTLSPRFFLAWLNLAHQLEEEQQWMEAEAAFIEVQTQDPQDIRTAYSLARVYSKTGQWPEALKQYQRQLQLDSNDPWCYHNIANCYLQLKRSREALIHFRKAQQLDPIGESGQLAQFVIEQLENELNTTAKA